MNYGDVFNFEDIVEQSVAKILADNGVSPVFVSSDNPDLQKDRPRADVSFQLGSGMFRWANINDLPEDLKQFKIESAWKATLTTMLVAGSNKNSKLVMADWRGKVRLLYLNLSARLNVLMPNHAIALVKETSQSRAIHPELGYEQIRMIHELDFSIKSRAWGAQGVIDIGLGVEGVSPAIVPHTTGGFRTLPGGSKQLKSGTDGRWYEFDIIGGDLVLTGRIDDV